MSDIKQRAREFLRVHAELSDLTKTEERIITDLIAEVEATERSKKYWYTIYKETFDKLTDSKKEVELLERERERELIGQATSLGNAFDEIAKLNAQLALYANTVEEE